MTNVASDFDYQGRICRICLHAEDSELGRDLVDIFSSNEGGFSIVDSLQQICAIQVSRDDNFPQLICSVCLPRLRNAFFLRVLSQRSQETLLAVSNKLKVPPPPSFEYIGFAEQQSEFKSEDEDTVSCDGLDSFRCCGCEQDFDDEKELKRHSIQAHCPKQLDLLAASGEIRCSVCYVVLDGEGAVRDHQERYPCVKALRGCSYCRCNFYSADTLELHVKQFHADQMYKCCGCEFRSDNQIDLATHTLFHKHAARKLLKEGSENEFQCAVCYARFETLRKRQIHEREPYQKSYRSDKIKSEPPTVISEPPEPKRPRTSSQKCKKCSAVFPDGESLRTHHCIVVFECPDCPTKFIKKESLESHKCTIAPSFSCKKCSKKYTSKAAMLACMRQHEIDQKFQCNLCYEYFKNAKILRRHKASHLLSGGAGERDNQTTYSCEVCGKVTNRRQRYVSHYENMHATDADRIYGCDRCEQRFSKDYFLANHMNFVHHVKSDDQGWKEKFCSKKGKGVGLQGDREGESADESDDV